MEKILKNMKGFRNILAHYYGEVDDELVFENFDRLNEFNKFIEVIVNYLKNLNTNSYKISNNYN